jgi:mRNA interferase RelE/StbE
MHEVYLTRRAQKEIEKLSHEAQDRVLDAIDDLMEDPVPPGSRKLKGDLFGDELDYYRIRVGDYRIISVSGEEDYDVLVARAYHRRDAYRRALASGALAQPQRSSAFLTDAIHRHHLRPWLK